MDHSKYIALSTQSVGVGPAGSTSMLARVAIVDYQGNTLLERFVKPTLPVSDYRKNVTGISQENLESGDALTFDEIQKLVANMIFGKIIVGHCLWNDLSVATRDVGLYRPFRKTLRVTNVIGLQTLMWHFMNREVQKSHIVPLENARAIIDLYRSIEVECEAAVTAVDWPFHLPPENFSRCYL